jgi:putative transcriptional regulator
MPDPNFAKSVVLLVSHDATGSLGLIVNQPTEVELREVLPDVELLESRRDPVYLGGPVSRSRMFLLVRSAEAVELTRRVVDDVHFGESPELLERLLEGERGSQHEPRFRAFAGYAGWGAGQLQSELERGDWHLLDGSGARVFSGQAATLWRRLLPRNEMEWSRLRTTGER